MWLPSVEVGEGGATSADEAVNAEADVAESTGHCRVELRESKPWKASGTNTLTVTGKVTKGSGNITVGQVFNDNNSIGCAPMFSADGKQLGFRVFSTF